MRCAACHRTLVGRDRFRLHFEAYEVPYNTRDKFFCGVVCIRDWATRMVWEAL